MLSITKSLGRGKNKLTINIFYDKISSDNIYVTKENDYIVYKNIDIDEFLLNRELQNLKSAQKTGIYNLVYKASSKKNINKNNKTLNKSIDKMFTEIGGLGANGGIISFMSIKTK